MKKMNVFLCGIVMMLGFAACSDDNGKVIDAYTEAEKKWIAENEEYFQARMAEREDDGSFLYKRLVVGEDTLLYRILSEGEAGPHPSSTSSVKVSILGKLPVSNTIIAGGSDETPIDDTLDLDSRYLIKGLAALLLETRVGDRVGRGLEGKVSHYHSFFFNHVARHRGNIVFNGRGRRVSFGPLGWVSVLFHRLTCLVHDATDNLNVLFCCNSYHSWFLYRKHSSSCE